MESEGVYILDNISLETRYVYYLGEGTAQHGSYIGMAK